VTEFCLLNKSELSIEGISLQDANLNEISTIVSETLGVNRSAILVTDVQGNTLVLDILEDDIDPYDIWQEKFLDSLLRRLVREKDGWYGLTRNS
jgi:hypothetical protein